MPGEPHLRPVPPLAEGADAPSAPPRTGSRLMVALTIALAIALGLLVWNRMQLTEHVGVLEDRVRALEGEVAERDHVIGAHRERLDDVRDSVDGLRDLLERPLPQAD